MLWIHFFQLLIVCCLCSKYCLWESILGSRFLLLKTEARHKSHQKAYSSFVSFHENGLNEHVKGGIYLLWEWSDEYPGAITHHCNYTMKKEQSSWHFNWINHSKMAFWCTGGILLSNVNLRGTNTVSILEISMTFIIISFMQCQGTTCVSLLLLLLLQVFLVVSFWALLKHHLFRTKENTQICKWGKKNNCYFFETRKQFGR